MRHVEDKVKTKRLVTTLINQLDIVVQKLEHDRYMKICEEEETVDYDPYEAHQDESLVLGGPFEGFKEIVEAFNEDFAVRENRLLYVQDRARELYGDPKEYDRFEGLNFALWHLHNMYIKGGCKCDKCGKKLKTGDTSFTVNIPYDETVDFIYCEDCGDEQMNDWETELFADAPEYLAEMREDDKGIRERCKETRNAILRDED